MESPYYEMTHDIEEEHRSFQSGYQSGYIKGYHDAMMKFPSMIVRCKDCKYGEETINAKGKPMVKCMGEFPDWLRYPDWFCADGARGKDDA